MAWYDFLFPDAGYDLDEDDRRNAALEALQGLGTRLWAGAGTEGFAALPAALNVGQDAYQQSAGRRFNATREQEYADLQARQARSLIDERERRAEEDRMRQRAMDAAKQEKARALTERMARHQSMIDQLAEAHPEHEERIRSELSNLLTNKGFEQRWASMLESLDPLQPKAEGEPRLVQVRRPDGSVVLAPAAAGLQVQGPKTDPPGSSYLDPENIFTELRRAYNTVVGDQRNPADASPEERQQWREQAWELVNRFVPPRERDAVRQRWIQPLPPPEPATTGHVVQQHYRTGPTVADVVAALPTALQGQVDESDRLRIGLLLSQGKTIEEILGPIGVR